MAERSNASDSSSDLSGGAGSNPVGVIIKKTYSDTFIIAKWITRWTQNPTGLFKASQVRTLLIFAFCNNNKPPWRNWIARMTSNHKVASSNLVGGILRRLFQQYIFAQNFEFCFATTRSSD